MHSNHQAGFRLSPQQKRLWSYQAENPAYRAQCSVLISGKVDLERLQSAIQTVVNRHDILRTQFRRIPGMKTPVMVIDNQSGFYWQTLDFNAVSPEDVQGKIQAIFTTEKSISFDGEKDSNLRVLAITLAANQLLLIVSIPALCGDNGTLKNWVAEVSLAYSGQLDDASEEEGVQYVQFSEWQHELLGEAGEVESGLAYWQQQDFSALERMKLPLQILTPIQEPFTPESYSWTIDSQGGTQLQTLAQQWEISPAVLLLTCWQILLHRISGESELIVGTIYNIRDDYEELESVFGLLSHCLPVRLHLAGELSLKKAVNLTTKSLTESVEWQDYIHSESLEFHRVGFPIGFEFISLPGPQSVDGISFSITQPFTHSEPFQVKLTVTALTHGLKAELSYDKNHYSNDYIQQLAEQFETLLIQAIAHPTQGISQLPILPEPQRQFLFQLNQTEKSYPIKEGMHQLFEEAVNNSPDAIALVFEETHLTYRQLNEQSNQLAHYLKKLGVGPDAVVGILTHRSHLSLVAMLGILKAGGAYLPLDAELPLEALSLRLQDIQPVAVVTEQSLSHRLPNCPFVCLDGDTLQGESAENLAPSATENNLAYILFTSGSTGQPKAVAIAHRQILNYCYAIQDRLNLPTPGSFALVSTLSADLGNTVIFPALCGGTLHIISKMRSSDPEALAEYFRQHPIDCLKIVPSHLMALLGGDRPSDILPRHCLVLGGETATWEAVATIRESAPNCRIFNHYGPTETTVGVLTYEVPQTHPPYAKTVPLGSAIANTQIYILDQHQQPVPIGVTGELYIGGAGVARGYLNRPELTQDKFIPNPFQTSPENRLYKTGDRARYLPDGTIEFLGRVDEQVKIRGFRIELGEIETVLAQHPTVRETVVTLREDEPGNPRLVAYIVPSGKLDTEAIREFLAQRLQEYMIPTAFVAMDSLPLTANGKRDRRALPTPDTQLATATEYIAPSTPVEAAIAGIWAELLHCPAISIHDDFFALGGHSLLATQAISRLRATFQVELPLKTLFEATTLGTLAERIEQAIQAELGLEIPAIVPTSRGETAPLSFAQQRLWFLDRLDPGSPSYNLPRAVRITGKLNPTALEQCFTEIVRRHEILRTQFVTVNRHPVQQIIPATPFTLPVIDLQGLSPEDCEAEVRRLTEAEAGQGFNLESSRLLRGQLLQLSATEWVLLFTLHHIVSDGWSTAVLIRELAALYPAFSEGKPSPLPALPIQYADFALWQKNWLQGAVLETQLGYWKQQLGGSLPVLELPTDKPRPPVQTFRGNSESLTLPYPLSESLKQLSGRQGVTLYMTLLAAFKTLLYRYSGQEDILVGSPIANRNHGEIEQSIGFFVNTLVLRTNLSDSPSFSQLLTRVRDVTLGAYAHQDLPFEKLVEALQPERDLSRSPLFQVMFIFQNAPVTPLELPGLTLEPLEHRNGTAKYDLSLYVRETESGLQATWEYNTDLFEPATIQRMQGHWQTLLEAVATAPETPISHLPLLTPTEEQQLLGQWNQTQADYPQTACLHQLFEAQVELTPEEVAVEFAGVHLTYRQLNAKANQLAHYLQGLGVEPERLVGLCIDRSVEMVIALLGILKAGGAYVPLDPSYPPERLEFMVSDSQVPILLTTEQLLSELPENQALVLCLDTEWSAIAHQSDENPVSGIEPDNLAYVIYTSGSTGKPKGAMNTHRGICNRLLWMQDSYELTASDRVLQKTPFSFDVSVWEFFWPLLTGARLIVAQPDGHKDSTYLVKLIAESQITTVHFVPSMLQVFLEERGLENCHSLRQVFCSGEALPKELADRFLARLGAKLHNLYGPTEAAVDVTFWECDRASPLNIVPIGRPVANTQIYILDPSLQPVPIGVKGELYIGGVQLARGYLNRPELTAEKFIQNPFDEPGQRLYKTGDLVRYLPNGDIDYLGRIDNQVKLRGYRIELGEIEAVLAQHPQVQQSVVTLREERLVAYWVKASTELIFPDLKGFLKTKLPAYMVPTAFVELETLPLTPNGKIDRKSLPEPDFTGPQETWVAPRTALEQQLAELWSEVLGIERIGLYDNFFELGGHSLLATQLISRIREVFQVELPLKTLFEATTIAQLGEAVAQGQAPVKVPAIARASRQGRQVKRSELN
ncbi:non-ribosomal peptide synthetase [Oscillatoria acuminata]|uniref:Amino acid adenylation enzyme/thioester reductase family protein n=1 Tax=Oscillatoria acuminata PCC 6304 TaxID=56110 RepID=K9TJV6_9CYAN|nr:non-ribosomal peptide synthetase [Oscillatoria acuminata]AFY82810.1 amino acid adenylation enzyme/thioester reductase family protein [Oscillatoria acuminata PCC 6304]